MPQTPWWKGKRGEWYVVVQIPFILLVFLGPRTVPGLPAWTPAFEQLGLILGGGLMLVGGCLLFAGMLKLGKSLTPVPHPRHHAVLVEAGPYRFVRHPIYSGGILLAFGWGLWIHGWLTIVYAMLLLVFFDVKARREERWLLEKFPGYAFYRQRVRKLIPFIY